jgi:hypothetical protein
MERKDESGQQNRSKHLRKLRVSALTLFAMTYRAKSIRKKDQELSKLREKWIKRAVVICTEGHGSSSSTQTSYAQAATQARLECLEQDKKIIEISTSTLQRRVNGGHSRQEGHKHEKWETKEEADIIIEFAIAMADRGFPLSHRRLKEHVDAILRARLGSGFPAEGVGKQWSKKFVSDHSDRLGTYWSRALDRSRARAVNPTTKAEYFDLLEHIIHRKGGDDIIPAELIYGADESGFQQGIGQRERVIGARGKKTQHQQRSGNRENITALVVICADGTAIPPAIIYKGDGFQVSWVQNNPLMAS